MLCVCTRQTDYYKGEARYSHMNDITVCFSSLNMSLLVHVQCFYGMLFFHMPVKPHQAQPGNLMWE